jgi:hypothetical protein
MQSLREILTAGLKAEGWIEQKSPAGRVHFKHPKFDLYAWVGPISSLRTAEVSVFTESRIAPRHLRDHFLVAGQMALGLPIADLPDVDAILGELLK